MLLRPTANLLPALLLSLLASACSSGGGGGGSTDTTAVVSLAASIQTPSTVAANEFVQLDGTASVGSVQSYRWQVLDPSTGAPFDPADAPVALVGTDAPVASFLAPDEALVVRIELQVEDGATVAVTTVDVEVIPSLPDSGITFLGRAVPATGEAFQAELSAFDPVTRTLFSTSDNGDRLDAIDLSDPTSPAPLGTLDLSTGDASFELPPTSPHGVAVFAGNGTSMVLLALQNTTGTDPQQQNGFLAFVDPLTLAIVDVLDVGPQPSDVQLNDTGTAIFAIVANEGQPAPDYGADPEGSFTIVELGVDGLPVGEPTQADFTAFNAQAAELTADGVRLFGANDPTVGEDLEPESVVGVPGTQLALGTLQENNALAIVNLAQGTVKGILGLGTKDWRSPGLPRFAHLTVARFLDLPVLGESAAGQAFRLGGFGGLHFVGEQPDGRLDFLAVPARGPVLPAQDVDGDGEDELLYALPDYQARWVRLGHDPATGRTEVLDETLLTRLDRDTIEVPISGRPNLPAIAPGLAGSDLAPLDLDGTPLALDAFGAHFGGLAVAPNGDVWLADRNRPSFYRFTPEGQLVARFVPQNTTDGSGGEVFGTETLPPVFGRRQQGEGFSALALDEESGVLYAWTRAPLDNPDTTEDEIGQNTRLMRVLGIDPDTGQQLSQHVFLLDRPEHRIGDAVWSGEEGVFWLVEHNGQSGADAVVRLQRLDLNAGTNLILLPLAGLLTGALEAAIRFDPGLAVDSDIAAVTGLEFVPKTLVADLANRGLRQFPALEGLARLDDGRLVLIADDASGLAGIGVDLAAGEVVGTQGAASETALAFVELEPAGFDASDVDGGAQFGAWPVLGLYQPDGIGVVAVDGQAYIVTANEGEARVYPAFDETARVGGLVPGKGGSIDPYPLDPGAFPDAGELELEANLGRLLVTTVDGDDDDDGDFDAIHAFGGRSFTVRDAFGRVLYDSGDDLARWTLERDPDFYHANLELGTVDAQSDVKGVEPEGVAIATVGGRPLLFLGCERSNGVFVFDLSTPSAPRFVDLLRQDGDRGPEGLVVVDAADAPGGESLLIVSYEWSGTVAVYGLGDGAGQ